MRERDQAQAVDPLSDVSTDGPRHDVEPQPTELTEPCAQLHDSNESAETTTRTTKADQTPILGGSTFISSLRFNPSGDDIVADADEWSKFAGLLEGADDRFTGIAVLPLPFLATLAKDKEASRHLAIHLKRATHQGSAYAHIAECDPIDGINMLETLHSVYFTAAIDLMIPILTGKLQAFILSHHGSDYEHLFTSTWRRLNRLQPHFHSDSYITMLFIKGIDDPRFDVFKLQWQVGKLPLTDVQREFQRVRTFIHANNQSKIHTAFAYASPSQHTNTTPGGRAHPLQIRPASDTPPSVADLDAARHLTIHDRRYCFFCNGSHPYSECHLAKVIGWHPDSIRP